MSIQNDTRRQCLPLCFRFSTSHEMAEFASRSYNQRHTRESASVPTSTSHKMAVCASSSHTEHHRRWQCLPLSVIFNITEEGLATFLNYRIQTAVFAPVCHIQHHTRRLYRLFLFSVKIILPSDVIKPKPVLGYAHTQKCEDETYFSTTLNLQCLKHCFQSDTCGIILPCSLIIYVKTGGHSSGY